jgi:transmembrane sensor
MSDANNDSIAARDMKAEALEWLVRLRCGDVTQETITSWTAWLAEEGATEVYDTVVEAWTLAGMAPAERPTLRELADDRYDGSVSVAKWLQQRRNKFTHLWRIAAVVALGLLGLSGTWWAATDAEPKQALSTSRAESRNAALSDGSQIRLGAMSAVSVSYSRHRRAVSLTNGEATFEVAHDRLRPFVVSTPLADVTAVGTAFNIDLVDGAVELVVTDGVVKVDPAFSRSGGEAPLKIAAGQRLHIDGVRRRLVVYETGVTPSRSWRDDRLEYRGEPLESVIQDVNRYTLHPIHLDEPSIGKLAYTGTVQLNAVDSWVYGLPGAFPVSVQLRNGRVSLSLSQSSASKAPRTPRVLRAPGAPQA